MNVMAGVDISLSENRSNNNPRALEPYRVFGALALSFDMLASRRNAEFAQKQKAAKEKVELERQTALSAKQVNSLTIKSMGDSVALVNQKIALANEKKEGRLQMDSMKNKAEEDARANKASADILAKKATQDSLSLILAENDLADEKEKRSDAEKQLLSTGELLLDAVYFKTGETTISINSKPYLNIIGKMLLKYPKLKIEVAGYTDNIGGKAYNVTLSQGRAENVRNYLVNIAPNLGMYLSARGYGMSMPKADNVSKEGRTVNRRVELRVINMDALKEYTQVW